MINHNEGFVYPSHLMGRCDQMSHLKPIVIKSYHLISLKLSHIHTRACAVVMVMVMVKVTWSQRNVLRYLRNVTAVATKSW